MKCLKIQRTAKALKASRQKTLQALAAKSLTKALQTKNLDLPQAHIKQARRKQRLDAIPIGLLAVFLF